MPTICLPNATNNCMCDDILGLYLATFKVNRLTCSQTLKLSACSEIKLSSTQMVELLRPLSLL